MGFTGALVGRVFFGIALMAGAVACHARVEIAEREYAQAVQTFHAGRTSEAFGRFMDLADRGDVDSARIVLFLHAYGPVLYGKHWDALPGSLARWSRLVENSGSSARALPVFLPTSLPSARPMPVKAARARLVAAR